jgi:hypothetical protein
MPTYFEHNPSKKAGSRLGMQIAVIAVHPVK